MDSETICENENLHTRLYHLVENGQWEKYIHSRSGDLVHIQKGGSGKGRRILMVTGTLTFNAGRILELLFDGAELLPEWNPRVVTCKVLKSIDQSRDITYHRVKGITGLLSPREFITQRQVGTMTSGNCPEMEIKIFSMKYTSSVDHPKTPGVVRGEQGLSGWILYETANDKTDFQWVVDLDIKLSPWIPYKIVENRLINELFEIVGNLRKYLSL